VRSFTSIKHRLLPCTEGIDQTDEDSSSSKDDPHFRPRDQTGNGSAEALSGGRKEENGGSLDEWHTVILTGHRGVGKSSIVASFLRSDKTSMKDSFASDTSPFGNYCLPVHYPCVVAFSNVKGGSVEFYKVFCSH